MSISLISITVQYSITTKFDNPKINLLIQAWELTTMEGSYLDNFVNLRADTLILILTYLRLMNSNTFFSFNITGKKWSRNKTLKVSKSMGPSLTLSAFY